MEFLHQHLLVIVLVGSGVLAVGTGAMVAHLGFGWPHKAAVMPVKRRQKRKIVSRKRRPK